MMKVKNRRFLTAFLCFSLTLGILGVFPTETQAEEANNTVIYDAAEISPFNNRTLQEVADRYAAARYAGETYSDGDSSSYYSVPASTEAPYAAGILTEDTHKAMTAMTNFYRWLVGVPGLETVSVHSGSLQAQALDRNFEFDHVIHNSSKPEDMDQELWDQGFLCTHNILARGYTPQSAITGWMNEGYSTYTQSWDTIGHRYALIEGNISDVQFGYSGSIAIGVMAGYENTMEIPFAAFPAPGYMPDNLVSPSSSSWSVELKDTLFVVNDPSAVTVTITRRSDGKTWIRTENDGTAQVSSTLINFVQPEPDTSGKYSGEYAVEISGLTDAESGNAAVVRYTTNFVDITETSASYITEVQSGISDYVIYQSMAENLEKVAAILPKEVTVLAENGAATVVPVAGKWMVDEDGSCFVNSVDANTLPSHLTDKNGILSRVTIPYTISSDRYDSWNSLSITPDVARVGENIKFAVYRTLISTDTSQIFKLTDNDDGTWSAELKFDSSVSADFAADESEEEFPNHIYNHAAAEEDGGEYISIYYESEYMAPDWGGTSAYVSTTTEFLTVTASEGRKGDINGDGSVTVSDLLMCLHHISGSYLLENSALIAADINDSGSVEVSDLLSILHYISGRIEEL